MLKLNITQVILQDSKKNNSAESLYYYKNIY